MNDIVFESAVALAGFDIEDGFLGLLTLASGSIFDVFRFRTLVSDDGAPPAGTGSGEEGAGAWAELVAGARTGVVAALI